MESRVPQWNDGDQEHLLGRCTLYEELEENPHSKVVSNIGTRAKLKWTDNLRYASLQMISFSFSMSFMTIHEFYEFS